MVSYRGSVEREKNPELEALHTQEYGECGWGPASWYLTAHWWEPAKTLEGGPANRKQNTDGDQPAENLTLVGNPAANKTLEELAVILSIGWDQPQTKNKTKTLTPCLKKTAYFAPPQH